MANCENYAGRILVYPQILHINDHEGLAKLHRRGIWTSKNAKTLYIALGVSAYLWKYPAPRL